MKVLFVQNIEGIAGSEKYFIQLIPKLKERGIEVEFLSVYLKRCKEAYLSFQNLLDEAGIESHAIEINRYNNPFVVLRLKSFFKKNHFDIIHSHLIYADFWMAVVKKMGGLKNTKTISTLHGYQEDMYIKHCLEPQKLPKNLYYKIAKFAYKNLDHVYACSYGLKKFYEGTGIKFNNGIDVIQHGFNYPKVSESKLPSDRLIISIIGRVIPRKGHLLVLEKLQNLADRFPSILLRIVGDGGNMPAVKQYVEDHDLGQFVEFTGFKSNVHYYYENSDLILLPSYAEGLPLVIFEAYNHSKPVVAFKTIGPEEAIEEGKTGALAEPFNSDDFAKKIEEILSDANHAKEMGKEGKLLLEKHFNLDRMTDETMSYYKSVLH